MIVIYIILVIAAAMFYILYVGAFSFYLFSFVAVLTIVLNLLLAHVRKRIKVTFLESQYSSCRKEKLPVIIKAENMSSVPVPNCIISIAYTSKLKSKTETFKINTPIFPKNAQYLTINISSIHYGTVNLKIKEIKIIDMLKIFRRKIKASQTDIMLTECNITITPDFIKLNNPVCDYSDMGLEADNYSKHKKGDDPSEIFDIHEYNEGDKISRIHWKLTAKQDKIMVKDYSLPITNSILICVDLYFGQDDRSDEFLNQYDTVIETAAALSMHLCEIECPHMVLWFDDKTMQKTACRVSDTDDYRYMINNLLKAQISSKRNVLLSEFDNEACEKYGHFLYCTADYTDKLAELIPLSGTAFKYSVLAIESNTSDRKITRNENDGIYSVVSVFPDKISESIENICL